ncbi:DUF433 domain-containing protein [Synechococcus sp. PCC 6312]|uniref:DUF433 domain-containing protein n=1 Tax=Synechococcus sp. (strain ATCC 27167 / PCC 6312) TaxID=195253 RepID=UPI00029F1E2B|nr:DUF433 domain-containing protein [Synechococcus sp. PCC 6312]AFY62023.1 hypothetical protein Syn6312_2964 [Synechococcus sp. PCC 6312]
MNNDEVQTRSTTVSNHQPKIIRTERGLTISGTRITLYDVMDYVTAQYPPKFIRSLFDLTEAEINTALTYIETNRPEVEAEYQLVLKQAEENRQYWEELSRQHLAHVVKRPPRPRRSLGKTSSTESET